MPCSLRLWTYLPPQAQIALLSLGFFLSFLSPTTTLDSYVYA